MELCVEPDPARVVEEGGKLRERFLTRGKPLEFSVGRLVFVSSFTLHKWCPVQVNLDREHKISLAHFSQYSLADLWALWFDQDYIRSIIARFNQYYTVLLLPRNCYDQYRKISEIRNIEGGGGVLSSV